MADETNDTIVVENDKEVAATINPFSEDKWKEAPSQVVVATDPVIEEKDIHIKEDKPEVVKPDEPEKIPDATPKPIQDRPDEVKEDIRPATDLKFANEDSEKVYNLLLEGETDKVIEIIAEQKKLANVDKLPPADIIKLNLQYQNKDYTPEEIQDLFNEKYEIPEAPVQLYETDEEFEAILDKYNKDTKKIEARIARDAKPATAELLALQKEIVLPDIHKGTTVAPEPTQEELERFEKQKELFFSDVAEAAKSFTGYNTTFKDEEVELKATYNVTEEEKKSIQPILENLYSDLPAFLNSVGWTDKEGKITPKVIEDLLLINNKEAILSKMTGQAATNRRAELIKSAKNIDYSGGGKGSGVIEGSQLQKQERLANAFFGD